MQEYVRDGQAICSAIAWCCDSIWPRAKNKTKKKVLRTYTADAKFQHLRQAVELPSLKNGGVVWRGRFSTKL
jgi:hypothetical protein